MFFIASQVLSWIILPVSQILLLFGLSIFLKAHYWKRVFQLASFSMLLFYSSPITSQLALGAWEVPATSREAINTRYDIGIVLTGITNMRALPADRPHFNGAADRITDAIVLYKEGKISKILISGGSGHVLRSELKESPILKDFAIQMGVKANDILIESESNNTRENALYSARIIHKMEPRQKILLITSASQMRRAMACFKKVGLSPDIYSTDIRSYAISWDFKMLIPSTSAILNWTTLVKEIVGSIVYWLVDYS